MLIFLQIAEVFFFFVTDLHAFPFSVFRLEFSETVELTALHYKRSIFFFILGLSLFTYTVLKIWTYAENILFRILCDFTYN